MRWPKVRYKELRRSIMSGEFRIPGATLPTVPFPHLPVFVDKKDHGTTSDDETEAS
jgi:hypothetical protein